LLLVAAAWLVLDHQDAASSEPAATPGTEARARAQIAQHWFTLDMEPANERVRDGAPAARPGTERKVVWRSGQYEGELTPERVVDLIRKGEAWLLESRLGARELLALRASLRDVDRAMQAVAELYSEEVKRAKLALANDPARHVRIAAKPRERDPRWPEVLGARKDLAGIGAVYGGVDPRGEIHYLVRWSEWPAIKRRVDEQVHLVSERNQQVAMWIAARYGIDGMAIFERTGHATAGPRHGKEAR
jgi:hypothetical protein